jgi:hypothetical protein
MYLLTCRAWPKRPITAVSTSWAGKVAVNTMIIHHRTNSDRTRKVM